MRKHKFLLWTISALLILPFAAPAGVILSEGFNDVSALPGAGWTETNNSTAGGTTSWFQGDPASAFNAQAGAVNSYVTANFNNAGFGGDISNWLILPVLFLQNGDVLTFWTRTETSPVPGDNLQVRLSDNGASSDVGSTTTSVGDFNTLLTTVAGAYPENWTEFTATVSGLAGPTNARLAFRYTVVDTSTSGDLIGIDSVMVSSSAVTAPEPATPLLLAVGGMALLAIASRRRSQTNLPIRKPSRS